MKCADVRVLPECEMCGREGPTQRVMVEGAPMMVCSNCSRFGKPIETPKRERTSYSKKGPAMPPPQQQRTRRPKTPYAPRKKAEKILIEDYGQVIQNAREALGYDRREFAQQIKETESLLSRIEKQKLIPSDRVVKKLEKYLEIELYVDPLDISIDSEKEGSFQTTIGAVVSIKKRKGEKQS